MTPKTENNQGNLPRITMSGLKKKTANTKTANSEGRLYYVLCIIWLTLFKKILFLKWHKKLVMVLKDANRWRFLCFAFDYYLITRVFLKLFLSPQNFRIDSRTWLASWRCFSCRNGFFFTLTNPSSSSRTTAPTSRPSSRRRTNSCESITTSWLSGNHFCRTCRLARLLHSLHWVDRVRLESRGQPERLGLPACRWLEGCPLDHQFNNLALVYNNHLLEGFYPEVISEWILLNLPWLI